MKTLASNFDQYALKLFVLLTNLVMKRKDLFYVCFISENNSSETVREYGHSKRGGLTGPQLLEGVAGKEGVTFFRGGGGAIFT